MSADITLSDKMLVTLPGGKLTFSCPEIENIAQAFGLRLLDWRRFNDDEAAEWLADFMRKHGPDCVVAALMRARRLAGRERLFWLTTIAAVAPQHQWMVKAPHGASDDEIWRLAFVVFLTDEIMKVGEQLRKLMMDQAIAEQV